MSSIKTVRAKHLIDRLKELDPETPVVVKTGSDHSVGIIGVAERVDGVFALLSEDGYADVAEDMGESDGEDWVN